MIFAIALGGAIGTVARYLVALMLKGTSDSFPVSTLLINVSGSFLIGFFVRAFSTPTSNPTLRLALTIGFCGGFTTFSAFSLELATLYQKTQMIRALVYVLSSVVLGVLATFAGLALGDRLALSRVTLP